MDLKEKEFYDFTKARTFGRLKGRRLTKNQAMGLEQLRNGLAFDVNTGPCFVKKKNAGWKLGSEMVST